MTHNAHRINNFFNWFCDFILNREWAEDGQLWVQYVSSTPATRLDVISLQEKLDNQLQARKARETGICPVREELYLQCFGECYYFTFFCYNLQGYFCITLYCR